MTIVIAAHDRENDRIIHGQNLAAQDSGLICHNGDFRAENDRWLMFNAGESIAIQIAQRVLFDDQPSIMALAYKLKEAMEDWGIDMKREREAPNCGNDFLVIDKTGFDIFEIGADFVVTRIEDYWAIGSGRKYALGALRGTEPFSRAVHEMALSLTMEERVRRGIVAAKRYDLYSPGNYKVEFVKREVQSAETLTAAE